MLARSTETNLTLFTDFIFSSLAEYDQVDAFFNDFYKAFDLVNHDLLIRKLKNDGVSGVILKSCLKGRSAQVTIKNFVSESF